MARRDVDDDAGGPPSPSAVVRLMPDYGGTYLWNLSQNSELSDGYALDPHDLGLSSGLTERLTDWYEAWERGWGRMSRRFGASAGTGAQQWYRQGLRLALQLQKELGTDVEVVYRDARGDERPVSEIPGS